MGCAQVLDARDPLRYRSEDMEEYVRELHPAKASLMLLNKADLLPRQLREAWADYFEARGVDFIFWSAKAATERLLDQGAYHCTRLPATRTLEAMPCLGYMRRAAMWQCLHLV